MQINPTDELIVILDFGAQYSQLIARRVRECKVYCEIVPFDTPLEEIKDLDPRGIILSGGPNSVYDPGAPSVDEEIYRLGTPILGICYGHQLMAKQLGGRGGPSDRREYGKAELTVNETGPLF